jgi:hypothetical protein
VQRAVRIARTVVLSAAVAATAAGPAYAQQTPPVAAGAPATAALVQADALRAEVAALRQQLEALERKIAAIEGGQPAAPQPEAVAPAAQVAAVAPAVATPPGEAGAQAGAATPPVYGNASALSKIFNPDMAVIGNFTGAAGTNQIDARPALALNEAEVSLQAVVDPYARADFFLAASPEGLEIEEGFLTFPTLPGGLLVKVGKLKAQFGKVNTLHVHALPWVDVPLPMQNLLGGDEGLNDAGISVSRLILNPVLFLEATGEIYNGSNGVFSSHERSDLTYVGRLRGYRDLTEGTNLDLGTSFAVGHNDARPDASTRLIGFDATLRYRPLRRAIYKRVLARTEMFWSRRDTALMGDRADAFGAYLSGEYQFARRWFAGGRYDWSDRAEDPTQRDKSGSLLLTYWPSEFSQIRGQLRRTAYAEGVHANELLFQFLFAIGAHGAHVF